ncbi:alpha/beta fold hydrolase [Mucilaginibacter sp. OK098]|uniref:alpha/beta fold hydrolase n=1 Tax=Mucilaginibacter sp. OK098 TaxID=1855297 RepID=UPI0009191620|nr:alpha/beta hydrolase [Mucilaginibacter sp. OK098]SHN12206.1 Pimeloyl-ACP methyl ester carboxylesterase [Mucilaginibacter sp. OK098]
MKKTIVYAVLALLILPSFKNVSRSAGYSNQIKAAAKDTLVPGKGYSEVNGIRMYYEIYGQGKPLVLIHGGGSTIQTTFGRIIPMLAKHRRIIAVELQAHGRTGDREKDLSFEQDADDIATLLQHLNIDKADFFGFSNGGTTAMQIAIRHPEIVDKIVLGSALCKRNGVPAQFWDFMKQATLANMPEQLKEAYIKVTPNPKGLQIMHDKDVKRMVNFKDIPDEQIESIKASTLIIIGDQDLIKPEHAIEMHRQIAGSELAIIPGVHGEYIGEITTLKSVSKEAVFVIPMIESFLDKSKTKE